MSLAWKKDIDIKLDRHYTRDTYYEDEREMYVGVESWRSEEIVPWPDIRR